ncbi:MULTISPECIES: EH signature domain-containing protein [unclassified Endozoicomonas]|uniref:EH signature domain-containing protein n=1 Tax=unclassified Endozoicomonas TaxID=2644528 RepID=UPI003BB6C446
MRLNIGQLPFSLPDKPFGGRLETIKKLQVELSQLATRAGTGNVKFEKAFADVLNCVRGGRDLYLVMDEPIKVRALALAFSTKIGPDIRITQPLLDNIDELRPTPTTLFIESLYQHFLKMYDRLGDYQMVARWLLNALPKRNLKKDFHNHLLGENGPQWVAQQAIKEQREFHNQVQHIGLGNYVSGRFMTVANNIYFVEQLKTIPVNEPHRILQEVQKPSVYEAPYDSRYLLGHKILETLITRAQNTNVHDSWLQVVIAIAGDPRVPKTHPRYQKWWSQLDSSLHRVVQGWLSKLDLRLFLEALEDFSNLPGKEELRRMFPSRKKFLEGLDDKELVGHTRLYLSRGAEQYLKMNYKKEHLPAYSRVSNGDKSLIYVQLANGQAHMVEGSHSCYLWIYRDLHETALVFDHARTSVSYDNLTSGLNRHMERLGCRAEANITHNPSNFHWQRQAIETLRRIGIHVSPQDVLSPQDYQSFKRRFGVM